MIVNNELDSLSVDDENGCWWVGGTLSFHVTAGLQVLLGRSDLGFSAWGSVVVSQPPAVYIA
jgi:hypothetical protein